MITLLVVFILYVLAISFFGAFTSEYRDKHRAYRKKVAAYYKNKRKYQQVLAEKALAYKRAYARNRDSRGRFISTERKVA
jgi:hypothetical protein